MGLEVIFTVEITIESDKHFDIRPYNSVLWKNEGGLRVQLENRIRDVMGNGFLSGRNSA